MMNDFVEQTEKYVKRQDMIRKGDVVAAGVSGGADSVCLLFVLCALRRRLGFTVKVCHVNHGLRGADADADEQYVRELCGRLGVECIVFHENVELIAAKRKQSLEEAGRAVRRAAFEKVCAGEAHAKIATAHHRDDNAETVLMNIARGTGLRGLCGIWPARGKWIRPLLWAGRDEIETFLLEQGSGWCTDATNEEDVYTRNRIRHRVIPILQREVNPAAAALDKAALEAEHPAVQKQLVKQCIARMLGTEKDIAAVHVRAVLDLLDKQSGRMTDLPGGIRAVRTVGGILFGRRPDGDPDREPAEDTALWIPGDTILYERRSGRRLRISCRITEQKKGMPPQDIPQKSYTKRMDYDIIKSGLSARNRRPGDYLTIDKEGNRQKLKSYFINEKIPREEREEMLLIADGPEIVWIPGYRMNCAYYVTDGTERILEIKITEDGTNVRDDQSIDPGRES